MTKFKINLLEVKNWDDLPEVWKVVKNVKKVSYKYSLTDEGLLSIFKPYISDDAINHAMDCIFVDNANIVATNGNSILCMPNKGNIDDGLYVATADTSKIVNKPIGTKLTLKFPNYSYPFQQQVNNVFNIDLVKLKTYCEVVLKGEYCNQDTYTISFSIKKDKHTDDRIPFSANTIIKVCNTFLQLGHSKIWCGGMDGFSRMYFSDSKEAVTHPLKSLGLDTIVLVSPQTMVQSLGSHDHDTGTGIFCYYSFEDDEIHNADGSVAVFDSSIQPNVQLPYMSNEELDMLKKATGHKKFPILDCVLVKDNVAYTTNFEESVMVKDVYVEDGIYEIISDALKNTKYYDINKFPINFFIKNFEEIGSLDAKELQYYVNEAKNFVGKEKDREIFMGIAYVSEFNDFNIYATNSYSLYSHKIEQSNIKKINKVLKSADFQSYMLGFMKSEDRVSLSYYDDLYKFYTNKVEFIVKSVERTSTPKYQTVIPNKTDRVLSIDKQKVLGAIKNLKGEDAKMNITLKFPKEISGEGYISLILSKENEKEKKYVFGKEIESDIKYSVSNIDNEIDYNVGMQYPIIAKSYDKNDTIIFDRKLLIEFLSLEKSEIANILYKSGTSATPYIIRIDDYIENNDNFTKKKAKKEPKVKVKKEVVVKDNKKSKLKEEVKVDVIEENPISEVYNKAYAEKLIDTFTKTLRFLSGDEKDLIEKKIGTLKKTIKFLNS